MTIDQKTLACVNLFGVFGAIPELCRLSDEAKELVKGKNASIGFDIKNTASATLSFANGACTLTEGLTAPIYCFRFPLPKNSTV